MAQPQPAALRADGRSCHAFGHVVQLDRENVWKQGHDGSVRPATGEGLWKETVKVEMEAESDTVVSFAYTLQAVCPCRLVA